MRVVVIPASKYGGTAEIGRAIATTLRERGIDVDVSQPEHLFDLSPYAAHIIGSGLYLGKWLKRAVEFVESNQAALREKPTWLFSSGPLDAKTPKTPANQGSIERLMAASDALDHQLFGGRLDIERLERTERMLAKLIGASNSDFRDWDRIAAWVNGIADQLLAVGQEPTPTPETAPSSRIDRSE